MTPKPCTGRPNKNEKFNLYEAPLYKVLVARLPSEFLKNDQLDTLKLSESLSVARYTVYCWFSKRPLSKKAARKLVELSSQTKEFGKKGALTKEDLYPFLGL